MWAIFAAPRIPAFGLGWTGLTGRGRIVRPLDRILRVCGDLDVPELGPDSPDLGVQILREYVRILRILGLESHTSQTGFTGLVYRSDR